MTRSRKRIQEEDHCCEHYYSWILGWVGGMLSGIFYEIINTESYKHTPIDEEDITGGFEVGFTETVWCCGLM